MERRWFKVQEVAEYLGLSPKTIYDLCSRGVLPSTKIKGIGRRIDRIRLDEFLKENETVPVQEQIEGR